MPPRKPKNTEIPANYKELSDALPTMSEDQLRAAMQIEVDKESPRADMLMRMVGRFNRLRGSRATHGVMGLLSYKGKRDVNSVLDNN